MEEVSKTVSASTSAAPVNDNLKEQISSADNDNLEEQRLSANNDITEEQRLSANNNNPKEQSSSADNKRAKQEVKNVKSLADLIGFCRDKGLQVYNDTSNVPEADRIRMEALGEQGGSGAKKHRSDDRDPSLPRRSGRKKSREKSLSSRNDRTSSTISSAVTKLDVTSRKTSAVPSISGWSQTTSRISSVLSTYDVQDKSKDAEELLQQRMRRRSKRRREKTRTLADLITEVGAFKNNFNMKSTANPDNSENPNSVNGSGETGGSNLIVNDKPITAVDKEAESIDDNSVEPERLQSDGVDEPTNTESRHEDNSKTLSAEPNNRNNGNSGFHATTTENKTDDAMQDTNKSDEQNNSLEKHNAISKQKEVDEDVAEKVIEKRNDKTTQNIHNSEAHVNNLEKSKTISNQEENDVNVTEKVTSSPDTDGTENGTNNVPLKETEDDFIIRVASNENNQQITNSAPQQEDVDGSAKQPLGYVEINVIEDIRNEDMNPISHINDEDVITLQNMKSGLQGNSEKITQNTHTDSSFNSNEKELTGQATSADAERSILIDGKSDIKIEGDGEISSERIIDISANGKHDIPVNRIDDIIADEDDAISPGGMSETITDDKRDISIDRKSDSPSGSERDTRAECEHDKGTDGDISVNVDEDSNSGKKGSTPKRTSKTRENTRDLLNEADVNKMKEEKDSDSEKVIEEVRIKDGNSTLVLYKVKEKSLLSLGENTDNIDWNPQINDGRCSPTNKSPESEKPLPREQNVKKVHVVINGDRLYDRRKSEDSGDNYDSASDNNDSVTDTDQDDINYVRNDHSDITQTALTASLENDPVRNESNVLNSELLNETNDIADKTELCETSFEINGAEHDSNININKNSSWNKDISSGTLSQNTSNNDQPKEGQSNSDKIQEKSMNGYNSDGDDEFIRTENFENVETLVQTMRGNTENDGHGFDLNVGHKSGVNLEGNAQITEKSEADDMAVRKEEQGLPERDSDDGESKHSGNERKTLEDEEMKKREINDNEMGEQASQSSSKKGMTAEEWVNFLREINRKKTNIPSEKMLSADARLIYLMEKAKKTNTDYGKEHVKTIILFEEFRGVFRKDLSFVNGIRKQFPEDTSAEENTETQEKADTQENDNTADEQEKVKESEENQEEKKEEKKEEIISKAPNVPYKEIKPKKKKVKQGPKLSEESLQAIREKYWSKGQGNSETFELDGEEYFLDPNGDLVKAIKFNASKKIDTRWDPNHPMFKKMSNKNKASDMKGIKQIMKATKPSKIDTGDLPANNVYVEEAKRIYPQGFEDVAPKENKAKKVKKVVKHAAKTKSVDIGNTGQEDTGVLTKIETTDNDKPVKRKLKRYVSVPTKIGVNDNNLSGGALASVVEDTNKRKLRKVKSVSSDSKTEAMNENEEITALSEGKKKRVRIIKQNNFVQLENDSTTESVVLANTENKTVVIKRKKMRKTKSVSDKEFEVDRAFLNEQKEFIEKTTKLNKAEKVALSNEGIIRKSNKPLHKNSIPELEFKSIDEESNLSESDTHSTQQNIDNVNQPDEEDIQADKMSLISRKRSKNANGKRNKDHLNALKIFKEARDDLEKDLSIVNGTTGSPSQNGLRKKLENGSKSSMASKKSDVSGKSDVSRKSDVSMSAAVDIVQSRSKFYNDPMSRGESKMKSDESLDSIRSEQYKEKRAQRTPSVQAF
ncbi:uncharacterized protein LOC123560850 [Mercenaria mercenaria]|uniref:uncharacterized protein LOC123560850 n=1 Tax=Mercenaria mercenaria TaxID=6596 RepID=UPI00234E3778|nr:uncharacterized protein LOC123560850 [Mercenaria mercenaria]